MTSDKLITTIQDGLEMLDLINPGGPSDQELVLHLSKPDKDKAEEVTRLLTSGQGLSLFGDIVSHLHHSGAPAIRAVRLAQSLSLLILLRLGQASRANRCKCGGCGAEITGPVYCGEKCRKLVEGLLGNAGAGTGSRV